MRRLATIALIAVAMLVLLVGCAKEEVEAPPAAPPPDPGWPKLSLQGAALQYQLEEAHYHIRKGRYAAPDSFGSEQELPIAMGYVQWASEMRPEHVPAIEAADHLILQHGSQFDAPYGYTPRCKWCDCPMPRSILYWPKEAGEKVVECPRCGARDSFPVGLVLRCPECHDVQAGPASARATCPTCGRRWRSLHKECSQCGLQVNVMSRQGNHCPRCKSKCNFDVPFGNWDHRAPTQVTVKHDTDAETKEIKVLGGKRSKAAAPAAPAGGGGMGGPGGGMGGPGGGMGGPGGPPGGGSTPGGMPGGGGPPGGVPPGGAPAGMAPGGAPGAPGGGATPEDGGGGE